MAGWNGSGVFVRLYNWVTDKNNGIKITASRMDGEFANYKTGLENCITRDGQNSPSADLPMAGHKHTGVADATASDQYATKGQLDTTSSSVTTLQTHITDGTVVAAHATLADTATNANHATVADSANSVSWFDVVNRPIYAFGQLTVPRLASSATLNFGVLFTSSNTYSVILTVDSNLVQSNIAAGIDETTRTRSAVTVKMSSAVPGILAADPVVEWVAIGY